MSALLFGSVVLVGAAVAAHQLHHYTPPVYTPKEEEK